MATQIGNATRGQPPPQKAQRQAAAAVGLAGAARRLPQLQLPAAPVPAAGGEEVARLQAALSRLDAEADGLQSEVDALTTQVLSSTTPLPMCAVCCMVLAAIVPVCNIHSSLCVSCQLL